MELMTNVYFQRLRKKSENEIGKEPSNDCHVILFKVELI